MIRKVVYYINVGYIKYALFNRAAATMIHCNKSLPLVTLVSFSPFVSIIRSIVCLIDKVNFNLASLAGNYYFV